MIKSIYTSGNSSTKDLYDLLFFRELDVNEITNNDEIMTTFTDELEKFVELDQGYVLYSIDIKKTHNIILLCKTKTYGKNYNFGYIIKEQKDIDTGTRFKVEEFNNEDDLYKFITFNSGNSSLSEVDVAYSVITKTLLGYRINKSKVVDITNKLEKYTNAITVVTSQQNMINSIINNINDIKTNITSKFNKMVDKYKLKLDGQLVIDSILNTNNSYRNTEQLIVAHIDDVININNVRFALITETKIDNYGESNLTYSSTRHVMQYNHGNNDAENLLYKTDNYRTFKIGGSYIRSVLNNINYNYIDKGRYLIIAGNSNGFELVTIFQDPKIKNLSSDDVLTYHSELITKYLNNTININSCITSIKRGEETIHLELSKYINNRYTLVNNKAALKALKNMYNEVNYVIKKNKSVGSDVDVTDSLKYIHNTGKLEYKDFAIAVDVESIKDVIYKKSNQSMLKHFRNEITEQEALDQLTDLIYTQLESFINFTGIATEINIQFNNAVDVKIEIAKGGNNFTYINNNRVNKNEIVNILQEVSCYNSQEAADTFIKNITKKGLSVFIGISSGYFYNNKFYKFKTTSTNGKYTMNIDGIDINIKGKKVFNTLYSISIKNERSESRSRISNNEYINNHVFKSALTKFDYIKYKIMIDKSYQLFIDKSKKFLDKKVEELNATYSKYFDNNTGTEYDAIQVTGTSGKKYTIAYTLKESFVFMSAEEGDVVTRDGVDFKSYSNGIYICMIDQSKMKATVGYDTVVSKLLSLKNDSVIASSIYNLEDELNK